jgi:hypothetical protein
VTTYEARQSPTRHTLVCASRTNNTYTFPALPRKSLCQDLVHHQNLTVHPHLPGTAHVHAYPCAVRHQFRILMNTAAGTVDLTPPRHPGGTAPTISKLGAPQMSWSRSTTYSYWRISTSTHTTEHYSLSQSPHLRILCATEPHGDQCGALSGPTRPKTSLIKNYHGLSLLVPD